ncbi:glycosyltransferase family protein [Terrabacter sp. BE26]|uniref:glycosyltransferase family protein n=1 Tax=Terrabacter sp. BE26 TaxID=2898152 RepID=UPI0035BE79BA
MRRHEPRLLIYSQDGLGLGHMRRTSLLAAEFLRQVPGASALTLSDSPLGQFFATAPGHDFLKLPSIRKAGPGEWEAVSLSASFRDVLALRRRLIASAVREFDPDILLVDHMPHGAMGELVPALRKLRGHRAHVVLGLRDIIDDPGVVRRRWTAEGAYEALEEFYDEVLVYGSDDVLDVAREYAWPQGPSQRLAYAGYVCGRPHPRARRLAVVADGDRRGEANGRRRRDPMRPPTVVVVAGGGADAHPMMAGVLDAAEAVHEETGARFELITGPFMPRARVTELRRRSKQLPMTGVRRRVHGRGRVARADLVVSMAGYNTTIELLNDGTPALLVPRSGPSAEQRIRASLFAQRGWVHWLDPDLLGTSAVADAIVRALSTPLSPTVAADLGGRTAAVARLTSHLEGWPKLELEPVGT